MTGKRRRILLVILVTGLVVLVLALKLPALVANLVVAPRAVLSRQGWRVSFSVPARSLPVDGYTTFLEAGRRVGLNPDFHHAVAWTIWFVPADGQYKVEFAATGRAGLGLDGKTVFPFRAEPGHGRERWLRLRRGPHLLRAELDWDRGGGNYSIGVRVPPLMRLKHLQGEMVAMPRLGSLDTWWLIMGLAAPLAIFSGILATAALLLLVLPLTLGDRPLAVGLTILLVLTPALLIPDLGRREPYIGPMVHQELVRRQPRFVFIGNSMLWSRIDDDLLSELLGGVPVYSIVNFGGLSGIHYLALKYLLIPSGIRPKRVFIFFRGTTLVQPAMRTTGPYFETLIKRISPAPDPEFERLAHGRAVTGAGGIRGILNRLFTVQGNRKTVRDALGQAALLLAVPGLDDSHRRQRQQLLRRVNDRFSLKNVGAAMDRESMHSSDRDPLDFRSAVKDSFLPAILRLGREHHLPLAFIRVQERPPADGVVQDSPEMERFMAELRAFLEENGAALYDFTGDPGLPLSMYGQGDHIREPKEYTPLFFKRVRALLR